MAETKISKTQTESGIWTSTNLTAGTGIQIARISAVSKEVTGFSTTSYLTLPTIDFTGSTSWDFTWHIKTGSDFDNYYPLIAPPTESFPCIQAKINSGSSVIRFATAQSKNSAIGLEATSVNTNTEYWFKHEFDGANHKLYQGTTKNNMTLVAQESGSAILNTSITFYLGIFNFWSPKVSWNGSIWITDLKINKNGVSVFDGSTDSYTVVGSPTIIDHPIDDDIYSISLQATGYDATKTQVLENGQGTLTWIDDPSSGLADTSLSNLTSGLSNTICTTAATTTSSASSATPAVIVENYVNGTSWYRVWSDGWCEQGGTSSGTAAINYTATIVFSKQFANIDYTLLTQAGRTDNNVNNINNQSFVYSKSATGFTAVCYGDGVSSFISWEAKGYLPSES